MPRPNVTVNSRKYDGTIRKSWKGDLVDSTPDLITLVGVFDREVEHEHLGLLRQGTVSYEFFPLTGWYNVFRFHESEGEFRNFYCNISMPPAFNDGILDYVDLDIDVIVWPDRKVAVLDREEFYENAQLFNYPKNVVSAAESWLEKVLALIEAREFPFGEVKGEPPYFG